MEECAWSEMENVLGLYHEDILTSMYIAASARVELWMGTNVEQVRDLVRK